MVDHCARTTSSSSVDRVSVKGNRAGGSMGSSLVMNGWWGVVVSSLFDLFSDGGSLTLVHEVRSSLVRLQRLSKFCPHFVHV